MARFSLDSWTAGKGGHYPKITLFEAIGYRWHEEVVGQFHASSARIRIPLAPARTSKSWSGAHDVVPDVFPDYEMVDGKYLPVPVRPRDDKRIWTVGPNYGMNKEFDYLYRLLVTERRLHGFDYEIVSSAFSPKQGNMEIVIGFGNSKEGIPVRTRIEGKSATNPESLQAEEVDVVLLAEAAEHDQKVWQRYLGTRCRKAIFPTTPKIRAVWLKELCDLAEMHPDLGIEVFAFTPKCNPDYQWKRYWQEHAQAETRSVGRIETKPADSDGECDFANGHDCFDPLVRCLAMQDPWFAEQFGGKWSLEAGRVLPFRWTDEFGWSHVIEDLPVWFPYAKYYVSMDYGFNDPAVALWWAVGTDGQLCLYRELYERGMDAEDFVARIKDMSKEPIAWYVGDPQQPNIESFLRKKGLPIFTRNKKEVRDRAAGGMKLVDALSMQHDTGEPRLRVLKPGNEPGMGCPKTIEEWKKLRRRPGAGSNEWSTAAIEGDDHAFDAARYFLSANPQAPSAIVTDINEVYEQHVAQVRRMERQRAFAGQFDRRWA